MPWIPRNVAAASIGTALVALVVVALAAAAARRTSAIVELQVAPRGPGSVAASPSGVDLDDDNAPVTEPCYENDDDDSCRWGFEQGQGRIVGALAAEQPIPKALAAMLDGQLTPDAAAKQAQADVEEIAQSIE